MAAACVQLDPPENLAFDFSQSEQTEVTLTIKNTTKKYVSFKVKTTAPKAYLVRPSKDLLAAGKEAKVQILLQPNAERNSPHRFLIQATEHDGKEDLTKEEWMAVPKDQVYERRLSVIEVTSKPAVTEDLQAKYEKLVQVANKLGGEVKSLKDQKANRGTSGSFATWQIILAMFVAVAAMKFNVILEHMPPEIKTKIKAAMGQ